MNRSIPIEPQPDDASSIAQLTAENVQLKERIETLERELKFNIELRYKEKAYFESHIHTLEENQGYLITEIRSLKNQAIEDNVTIGQMAGTNIDLRSDAAERQEFYETSKRDFKSARKEYEDATIEMHKSKKQR